MTKEEDIRQEYEDKNRWTFVHSYLKNMVLNFMSTIMHVSRVVKDPVIQKKEDINSSGLREVYSCFDESYDEWLEELKTTTRKGNTHRVELRENVKYMLNVAFTICEKDWIYENLAKKLYYKIGESYVKNVLCLSKEEIDMIVGANSNYLAPKIVFRKNVIKKEEGEKND